MMSQWRARTRILIFALILIDALYGEGKSAMGEERNYPISDHYNGSRFFNPWGNDVSKSIVDVLKWRFSAKPRPWPDHVENSSQPVLLKKGQSGSVYVTYVGHATTLIQDGQISLLTDPQWSERASPASFLGPKRIRQPGVDLSQIDHLDFVLISHNHYDHLDLPTLQRIDQLFHPQFIVPLGNARILQTAGITRVKELDWWESFQMIQLVPVQHWSTRSLIDRNQALWGGYVITLSGKKLFFAGDTGYGPHFKMIRQHCGDMDLSLLPIGAYEPRWFMKEQHMNPDDAVMAHLDLGSKRSLAIHFETFRLTDEGFAEPREELKKALSVHQVSDEQFLAPQIGQTLILK